MTGPAFYFVTAHEGRRDYREATARDLRALAKTYGAPDIYADPAEVLTFWADSPMGDLSDIGWVDPATGTDVTVGWRLA